MRRLGWRFLRIALVAIAAFAVFHLLEPYDLGWVVLPAAVLATVLVGAVRWTWIRRKHAVIVREQAWAEAVLDDGRRPRAIADVRRAVADLLPVTHATRSEHARLTVLLAQLLDADGSNEEGQRLLDAIPSEGLGPVDAAVLRHGQAVLRLRAEQPERALEAVLARPRASGESELDLRLELLEASARLELGEPDRALETATRVRRAAGGDEELVLEARVVRAAALDVLGQRDEAVAVLRSLGDDVVEMLASLGQPRVRDLAEAARAAG